MSTSIDQAFIKQFEREVHQAFQRQGSKLRGTVRMVNEVNGSSAVFQKVGKGTASTKSTHGMVPVMNLSHTSVECTLQDFYAGDWVDRLDELATASANIITDANTGLTKDKVLEAFETFGENDVPDDGQRFAVVGWKQWSELLKIDEFVNADYIGSDNLPYSSMTQAKMWLGTLWIPHSGLPIDGSDIRSCYHKNALGHASGCRPWPVSF